MDPVIEPAAVPPGTVVVGVDGSDAAHSALMWAVEQAALEQRQLTLVHSVEALRPDGAGAEDLLGDAASAALARHRDLTINRVSTDTDPRAALLGLSTQAAMIVVGSRGRGTIASLLLGSVSVAVSKHADCPVVVRRPDDPRRPRYGVLVGVDGPDRSRPAIEFAFRIAASRTLPVTVLHCYWDTASALPGSDLVAEEALADESLEGMAEKHPDVEVEVRLVRGFADHHLVIASRNYDLIVVGHHPITRLDDLIYGSVAPTVVEHAHGAVAVVPCPLHVSSPRVAAARR